MTNYTVEPATVVAEVRRAIDEGARWNTPNSPYAVAASKLGLSKNRVCELWREFGGNASPEADPAQPPSPAERHDAAFWKQRNAELRKELDALHHLVNELGGLAQHRVRAPAWAWEAGKRSGKSRAIPLAVCSDWHYEEMISPDEILGINEFNPEVCKRRVERYFRAFCDLGTRWAEGAQIEGAVVAFLGDMITGRIHEELDMTNALTSPEAVYEATGLCVAGIRMAREAFGRVHVVGTPGNHGRTTKKPTSKLYSRLSYDTLIYRFTAREFEGDDRVTFDFGASKDIIVPIFGRTALFTHGDKMGTRGGMGFAGPMLPIVRGAKKIHEQQASVERTPDLICHGHWHVTGNAYVAGRPVLSNGSVPGYSEYADDLRVAVEPPQQWAALLDSEWWLMERLAVQLEVPRTPDRPKVRVPARMR